MPWALARARVDGADVQTLAPTPRRRSVSLRLVPDAPLKVLRPLPVISLGFPSVTPLTSTSAVPGKWSVSPASPPCPCPLIHAQKCDTASPTCGPCRRSRANLECSYDPTSVGPHPLHLRRGQACLPCRCAVPRALAHPFTEPVYSVARKR